MYCKAGVQCTNPEVYGDIKRGRRLAPSKGILCSKCQGKCCNESCLERHKCKQRNRPNSSGTGGGGMRVAHHARWQSGLDANGLPAGLDPNMLLDPNMAMLLARNGMLLPQGARARRIGGRPAPGRQRCERRETRRRQGASTHQQQRSHACLWGTPVHAHGHTVRAAAAAVRGALQIPQRAAAVKPSLALRQRRRHDSSALPPGARQHATTTATD
jgi:hypothetical protein